MEHALGTHTNGHNLVAAALTADMGKATSYYALGNGTQNFSGVGCPDLLYRLELRLTFAGEWVLMWEQTSGRCEKSTQINYLRPIVRGTPAPPAAVQVNRR